MNHVAIAMALMAGVLLGGLGQSILGATRLRRHRQFQALVMRRVVSALDSNSEMERGIARLAMLRISRNYDGGDMDGQQLWWGRDDDDDGGCPF